MFLKCECHGVGEAVEKRRAGGGGGGGGVAV